MVNAAEKFSNYQAFRYHFGDLVIEKVGSDDYIVSRPGDDIWENRIQRGSKEYINGWMYGAVQRECGQIHKETPAAHSEGRKGRMNRKAEFDYILAFVAESCFDQEIGCDYLRSLWTAYCLHYGMDVDTSVYDNDLRTVWEKMEDEDNGGESETAFWSDFDSFDLFMGKYLA